MTGIKLDPFLDGIDCEPKILNLRNKKRYVQLLNYLLKYFERNRFVTVRIIQQCLLITERQDAHQRLESLCLLGLLKKHTNTNKRIKYSFGNSELWQLIIVPNNKKEVEQNGENKV